MAREKIDYGIYLGLNYSAICRVEKGKPTILKSYELEDIIPSCVSVNRRGNIIVGSRALNELKQEKRLLNYKVQNTYAHFMRTMGLDTKYHCSYLNKDFTSEELSSEVMKFLKSFVTDESVDTVVITIPAKLTLNQIAATKRAAKMAGFKQCELIQEPIAAAISYGIIKHERNEDLMVFNLEDETFEATLLSVEDGIMKVFDTEGDNYLGGDNLDYAIVDNILIPYIKEKYSIDGILSNTNTKEVLRNALKTYAEDVRNQLYSKDQAVIVSSLGYLGEDEDSVDIELDLSVTKEEAFNVMRPYYQRAVDICKELLKRNGLMGSQISKLILVGDPTQSPLIRDMLKEQVTPNVDASIEPITAIAKGAALYASTIDANINKGLEVDTVKLNLGFDSTTVETTVWISASLDKSCSLDKVFVELVRADGGWSSERVEINKAGDVIEANLLKSKLNSFTVKVYDDKGNLLPCLPKDLDILQGVQFSSLLPYSIGIGKWNSEEKRILFYPIHGLEKGKPIPAIGVIQGLKTDMNLIPGNTVNNLTFQFYQADGYVEGMSAKLFEHVADLIVSGSDLDEVIPKNSEYDLVIKVNSALMLSSEFYFVKQQLTISKTINCSVRLNLENIRNEIQKNFKEVQCQLNKLAEASIDFLDLQEKLDEVKKENLNDNDLKAVLYHQKDIMREIEIRMIQNKIKFNKSLHIKLNVVIDYSIQQQDEAFVCIYLCTKNSNEHVHVTLKRINSFGIEDGWQVQDDVDVYGNVFKVKLANKNQKFKITGSKNDITTIIEPNIISINN